MRENKMGVGSSTNQTYPEQISSDDEEFLPCENYSNYQIMQDPRKSCNYTTDAVETGASPREHLASRQVSDHLITVGKVAEIEKDLNFYEKVSLVYLLYDDAEIALQHLIQLQQGAHIDVLAEWARFCIKTDNWQGKLVEALCIIQNYQLICQLGYDQTEVSQRFLPLNENTSLFIDLIKKKLYRICENFTNERTSQFLDIIQHDFVEKKLPFRQFDVVYLEMYLLHWITVKYISLTDFSNLFKALKVMEMYETADNLKSLTHPPSKSPERLKSLDDNKNVKTSSAEAEAEEATASANISNYEYPEIGATLERSLSSVSSAAGSIQQDRIRKSSYEDKSYPMDVDHPGVCLIINQEEFYTEFEAHLLHLLPPTNKKLEKREGTNIDRDRLDYTFKKLGFTVVVVDNQTHTEMKTEIKAAVNMITNQSSLIICILSHGIEGKVYGVNSIPVEVREIQNIMCKTNVANLRRKPKVLILQSCQGTECQQVVEGDEEVEDLQTDGPGAAVPRTADVLVFWATVPGYGAVRDRKRGTWFIQSLCNAILQNAAKMHFEDICTLVKQEVIDKRWETKKATRAMVPIKESTLSRFFFLPWRPTDTS